MQYTRFMMIIDPNIYEIYFKEPSSPIHKQYIALRSFFADGLSAEQVAGISGYSVSTVYSLVRDFKDKLSNESEDPFFKETKSGRKPISRNNEVVDMVINLRKKYFSVPDIQTTLDALGFGLSSYAIEKIIIDAGFARLPRRDKQFRNETLSLNNPKLSAPIAARLCFKTEEFSTQLAGLLCILPYIIKYGIDKAIQQSPYPETKDIDRLSSILSFVALKLSSVKRYSADDAWCMDRGMGLFAGLNVLPKNAWFSSYSSRVTRDMNLTFLKNLHSIWVNNGLLSDTVNLDFTAIPYWGDDEPFENNWSGKRNKALAAIQAVLAQDPENGLLCYGDTTIRHNNQDNVVLEFLDFYHTDKRINNRLKYLVFDSKFTSYKNLSKLNEKGIKFITIRRRSKSIIEHINTIDSSYWKKITVGKANGRSRTVTVCDEVDSIKDYDGTVRQVYIKDNGKTQPAIMITNDFNISLKQLVRKYSRRWLVETDISEHIDFFHLNRNSSGIVIKVDFDLTMTILTHNLYRLFCKNMEGYENCEAQTIFDKFLSNPGHVTIEDGNISIKLKKKRTLPALLENMNTFNGLTCSWLNSFRINFLADSAS